MEARLASRDATQITTTLKQNLNKQTLLRSLAPQGYRALIVSLRVSSSPHLVASIVLTLRADPQVEEPRLASSNAVCWQRTGEVAARCVVCGVRCAVCSVRSAVVVVPCAPYCVVFGIDRAEGSCGGVVRSGLREIRLKAAPPTLVQVAHE